VTVDELNALECDAFVAALGFVAEDAAWVAHDAWGQRPFRDALEVVVAFRAAVARAPERLQRALVALHASPLVIDAAYEARFGFPFVVFDRGQGEDAMRASLAERLGNDPDLELAIALDEVVRSFRRRIDRFVV
jgi:2-oxo-4-hydroxy-4-carboxy-5-ureidoimidazoline decarboxylase